jgi:acyl-CoA reductase-like NAD-dependent aldehyde dehydrogenase
VQNAGQTCSAGSRLLVENPEEFWPACVGVYAGASPDAPMSGEQPVNNGIKHTSNIIAKSIDFFSEFILTLRLHGFRL